LNWWWLGIILLVFGPPLALLWQGAKLRWLVLGVASWFIALCLKMPAMVALYGLDGEPPFSPLATASIHGLISAAAELGLAALFLFRRRLGLVDVLAFGAGIGSFEVLWVLWEGFLELYDAGEFTRANFFAIASGLFLVERTITFVGHVASRVLIYAALVRRDFVPAAVAVIVFLLCDGGAVYGGLAGWRWDDPWVLVGFDVYLATLGILEAVAAWYFGRDLARKSMTRLRPSLRDGAREPAR
jgi:hypothetical protein